MSDLISRGALIAYICLECTECREKYEILNWIENFPTAFDVEKVIDELEGMIDSNVDSETGIPCDNWVVDMQNEIIAKCIEIVKKFGARKGE